MDEEIKDIAQLEIPNLPAPVKYVPQHRKSMPAVVGAFPALIRGKQILHVRCLQYSGTDATLDIREWLRTETFDGYSRKGISITLDQLLVLEEHLPTIKKVLESLKNSKTSI